MWIFYHGHVKVIMTQGWIKWFLFQGQGFKKRTPLHNQLHQCDDFLSFPCHFMGAVLPPSVLIHAWRDQTAVALFTPKQSRGAIICSSHVNVKMGATGMALRSGQKVSWFLLSTSLKVTHWWYVLLIESNNNLRCHWLLFWDTWCCIDIPNDKQSLLWSQTGM